MVKIRACVLEEFGVACSQQGACKLAHRLRFVFAEPMHIPGATDEQSRRDFIMLCERIMNNLRPRESVVFADAAHTEYRSRPAHGWLLKDSNRAAEETTERRRLNICGSFRKFAATIFEFFDGAPPESRKSPIDTAADNFLVISHDERLVIG